MRLTARVLQRAAHLGGVVAVVGVEPNAADGAGVLEAAVWRGEMGQRIGHDPGLRADLDAGGHRRQGVHHVEFTRHLQLHMGHALALEREIEACAPGLAVNEVRRPPLVGLAHAVGDGLHLHARKRGQNARIVAVAHAHAIFRQEREEAVKRVADVVQVLVEIEVILLDVGDDRDGGVELQEARVELACLHDERLMAAHARAAADVIELAADVHRGIEPGVQKRLRDHRGGGRLAVRAADVDGVRVALHQLAQQRGALHLRDAQARGFGALGVLRADGGGVDDQVRAVNVFGAVTDVHGDALVLEHLCRIGSGGVGAGDGDAGLLQHAGQAAHGAAADADHVRALAFVIPDMRHNCLLRAQHTPRRNPWFHYYTLKHEAQSTEKRKKANSGLDVLETVNYNRA